MHAAALAAVDDDFERGRYRQADLLWPATLKRATEISRKFTRALGCRPLDVLHVASALELDMRALVTFDVRQKTAGTGAEAQGIELRLIEKICWPQSTNNFLVLEKTAKRTCYMN